MRWGLTGGIASGKSTVSVWLEGMGAHIVDADRIAREVVAAGTPLLADIAKHFGKYILNEDGTLNRKRLAELIFQDPAERKWLQDLLHPAIRAEMRRQMDQFEAADPEGLVVADIPLLYESGLQDWFAGVLLVYVPREVQKSRLMARDGCTGAEADARLNAQMDIEEKKKMADFVIDNQGSPEESRRQLEAFWLRKGRA